MKLKLVRIEKVVELVYDPPASDKYTTRDEVITLVGIDKNGQEVRIECGASR
jgi:hypothetical protein